MRLSRLDLERYGRFTDGSMAFPRGSSDLHIIYGPNEAGKSTTRKALCELMFGFAKSTPYNFLHDYSELRLRACVDTPTGPLEVIRRKTNRQSLIDPDEQAIPDEVWREVLGSADQPFFERMFALDHSALIAGGKDMLDSHSDVGRTLFQAAAGLTHFNQVRAALSVEAAQWWAGRQRKDVRFFEARARLEASNKALKEHGVSEAVLASLQRDLANAKARAEVAKTKRLEAYGRTAQLERVRRVAPKLQQLALLEADGAVAPDCVILPPDARDNFRLYEKDTLSAAIATREVTETLDEQERRRDALTVDDALLAQADRIDALTGELSANEQTEDHLPSRKVERENLRREVTQALAELGWPAMDPADVPARLPSAPQRERLLMIATDHGDHEKALGARRTSLEAAKATLAGLRTDLARLAEPSDRVLDDLILAAASVLEGANARQLTEAVVSAESALRLALETLGWTEPPELLRALQPPSEAVIAASLRDLADQRATLAELTRSLNALAAESARVDAELAIRQRGAVPDGAALQGARSDRDQLLSDIIDGTATPAEEGENLRGLVSAADGIADIRYADAEAAALTDGLLASQAGLAAQVGVLAEQISGKNSAVRHIVQAWESTAQEAGLVGVTLEAATAWAEDRRAVLQALERHDLAQESLRAFTAAADREATRLSSALDRKNVAGVSSAAWLQTLVNEAREALRLAAAQRARRTQLEQQILDQKGLIAREQVTVTGLADAQALQDGQWVASCEEAGIPPETLPRALERVLAVIESLRGKSIKFVEHVESRIQPMERTLAAFKQRVAECAAVAAPALAGRPPFDVVRALAKSLQVARDAANMRLALNESIDAQRTKLRLQARNREAALSRLGPLLSAAGVDVADLDQAITASDARRHFESSRDRLIEAILEHGEGRSLEQLGEEVAAVSLDQIEVLLADSNQAFQAADIQLQAEQAQAILAQSRLELMEANDGAARARTAKGAAHREMADAVESYVGLQTQALMLDWALKRYREEKQGPLLLRASDYFAKLTCGEHVRLTAEEDGGTVTLASRRAGPAPNKIGLEAMSEGTRDQLYLALRLAALELHLERNVALPFIADDLLVNFDDTRAHAALGCLAEIGQRTQVIYLTHHRHLIDLARNAVGADINVIEL